MVFAIDPPSGHALSTMMALVSNGISAQNSKRAYERAIVEFLRWCRSSGAVDFTKGTLQAYRSALESRALSASTINVSLCAIRKLATERRTVRSSRPPFRKQLRDVKFFHPGVDDLHNITTNFRGNRLPLWIPIRACVCGSTPEDHSGTTFGRSMQLR